MAILNLGGTLVVVLETWRRDRASKYFHLTEADHVTTLCGVMLTDVVAELTDRPTPVGKRTCQKCRLSPRRS